MTYRGKAGRRLRLFVLACLLPLSACTAAKTPSSFRRTSPTGQTLFEVGLERGLPDGVGTAYHPNGAMANQGPYRAGKRHGLFHFWDDQGLWQRQESYIFGNLGWTSTEFFVLPPKEAVLVDAIAAKRLAGKQTSPAPSHSWVEDYIPPPPRTRFINGLDGHGSFAQVTMGTGSDLASSSAQRLSARGSLAKGRLAGSAALIVARYEDSSHPSWAKPVADVQLSYLLPHHTGMFIARAGFVFPLGNDTSEAALAGAAGVSQSPNEAMYVMPSTLVPHGSISWLGGSEYVRTQIDLGLDVGIFGYAEGIHPIVHANGAVGLGAKEFLIGAEVATAMSWTDTMTDLVLFGGALYGTLLDTTVGVFAGRGGNTNVVRLRMAHDF